MNPPVDQGTILTVFHQTSLLKIKGFSIINDEWIKCKTFTFCKKAHSSDACKTKNNFRIFLFLNIDLTKKSDFDFNSVNRTALTSIYKCQNAFSENVPALWPEFLTPSLSLPWLNDRKQQITAEEVYNEEVNLGGATKPTVETLRGQKCASVQKPGGDGKRKTQRLKLCEWPGGEGKEESGLKWVIWMNSATSEACQDNTMVFM